MRYAFMFVLLLSLALLSCAKEMDVAQVRKSIEEANAKWVEAFNQGDAAAAAALYTNDATTLPPNSEMIQGRQGIQEFLNGAIEMGAKDITLTTVDVGGSGDTAYEIGKYSITIQPEGQEAMTDSGKYVAVWKRQADGTWKLHVDIWNTSMPAQP
ncbi:MAG: YybH family protein [bacterium]